MAKFDSDFELFEDRKGRNSIYTLSNDGCDCPQGHKDTCRHRKMLPFFLENEHIDDGWFFSWSTHQWLKPSGIFAENIIDPIVTPDLDVRELVDTMEYVGITTVVIDEHTFEGSPKDVSAVPSPQPSPKTFRRMK